MPRRITFIGAVPVMMNPPMPTLSPVPTRILREAGWRGGDRRGWTGAGDRRRGARPSAGILEPGFLVPAAAWWRRHWERTGLLEITVADEGWQLWLDWHKSAFPDNASEIKTLEADRGEYLGYVRVVGRRRGGTKLEDYCWPGTMKSAPPQDTRKPLLRGQS